MAYTYHRWGPVPNTVQIGDFVHDDRGSWELWRVLETYEPDSPYVYAIRVTGSKYSSPGDCCRLLAKESHVLEPDVDGFVKFFVITPRYPVDLQVSKTRAA